jgi:hypothetical protein
MPLGRSKALLNGGWCVTLVLALAAAGLLMGCGGKGKDEVAAPSTSVTEGGLAQDQSSVRESVALVEGATLQDTVETQVQRAKAADQGNAPSAPARGRSAEQDSKVQDSVEITIRGPDGKVKQRIVK